MGMYWQDSVLVDAASRLDCVLPPKIFTSLADEAQWILYQAGINFVIHNLDNFLLVGPPESREYTKTLEILLATFHHLDLPIAA